MAFDYSTFDWLNRIIIPILTAVVSFFLYKWIVSGKAPKMAARAFNLLKGVAPRLVFGWTQFVPLVKSIRLQYDSREKCIIWPVFIAIAMFCIFTADSFYIYHQGITSYGEPLWLALLSSVVIAPISEEILIRGFFFGIVFIAAMNLVMLLWGRIKKAMTKSKEKIPMLRDDLPFVLVFLGLLVQGAYFGSAHDNGSVFSLLTRAIAGVAYGALFYYNRKNLMPSIVCHATYNLLIILTNPFVLA